MCSEYFCYVWLIWFCVVVVFLFFFFSMIRRPPRSTQSRSSAASDVYKRQTMINAGLPLIQCLELLASQEQNKTFAGIIRAIKELSLIHISEPTRLLSISYAVFCLKKKKQKLHNYQLVYNTSFPISTPLRLHHHIA